MERETDSGGSLSFEEAAHYAALDDRFDVFDDYEHELWNEGWYDLHEWSGCNYEDYLDE